MGIGLQKIGLHGTQSKLEGQEHAVLGEGGLAVWQAHPDFSHVDGSPDSQATQQHAMCSAGAAPFAENGQ